MDMHLSISSFLFVLIGFSLQNQVLSSPSPVILWSNEVLPKSAGALSTQRPLDLISDNICTLPNEIIQLEIIAVKDFLIEDIYEGLQNNYPLLTDIKKDQTNLRYYPNCGKDAYDIFSKAPQSNNMKCARTHFQLSSSQIYETLHDALNAMQEKINKIGTNTDKAIVIALMNYPTQNEQSSRKRRATNQAANSNIIVSDNKTCMFYAQNAIWINKNGDKSSSQSYNLNLTGSKCVLNTTVTNSNQSSAILDLVWINPQLASDVVNMRLVATIIGQYWYLTNITVNDNLYRYFAFGMQNLMDTPPKFSYVCTTATFVRYDDTTKYGKYNFTDKFNIKSFQFQPFYGNGSFFGPPNYCTSFFTSGIWMGITSSLLCLAILLFGITRMMSIKSNDRFDDPKGKPLIIKAQE
ncbi:unnamed protein product [Adineta steineri]|uniref:V-type proton ATPase subunit S1 n=1 Tax=Adineta steineri TaxID=433720 RepID=A0A813W902_9BILA|nr:unnamed protein product [Adineta steineri]CAF1390625.1 unnamed protein product [Adineta steineri]